MEMAKVTSKGQITIPISIRKRLKINEGDKLLFIDRPDGVMMVNPDMLGSAQEGQDETLSPESVDEASKAVSKPVPAPKKESAPRNPSPTEAEVVSKPPSTTADAKTGSRNNKLNLDALLDEIRSIGRKI